MKQKYPTIFSIRNARLCHCVVWIAIAYSILENSVAYPCSAIARHNLEGEFELAANFDWKARGGHVFLSPRGQIKAAEELSKQRYYRPVRWVSRYASLTLSQFGRDYPMQGINERGLSGAVLMAPASYPRYGRYGVITENLWLQHQLDQYATIQEVSAHLNDFGIRKISADLHWFLCDASGECATIEFSEGSPRIYRTSDKRMHVITNSPVQVSWGSFQQWKESSRPLPQGYMSIARFIRLAWNLSGDGAVDLGAILNDAALDGFTAWQSIFSTRQRSVSTRLAGSDWLRVSFAGLKLECNRDLPMLNLKDGSWKAYDPAEVHELLKSALDGLTPDEASDIELAVRKSESVLCR